MLKTLLIVLLLLISSSLGASGPCGRVFLNALNPITQQWVGKQLSVAETFLLKALHPPSSANGSVMASPSTESPNYYYHWVRDSALAIREIQALSGNVSESIVDFARFSRRLQLTENKSGGPSTGGLGEPKFEMSGSPFQGEWARPQCDGPALRASTLIPAAQELMRKGNMELVKSLFYTSEMPARTVIKADLEYILEVTSQKPPAWKRASVDIWEEVIGNHFYTRLAQWRALVDGARFAKEFGDKASSQRYEVRAKEIEASLDAFFSPEKGYVVATLETGRLDIAVLLAVLHSSPETGSFSVLDPRIMATVEKLEEAFRTEYKINQRTTNSDGKILGVGFGRYPGDTYDGVSTEGRGNPWFLSTQGAAEYYFKVATAILKLDQVQVTTLNLKFYQALNLHSPVLVGAIFKKGTKEFDQLIEAIKEKGFQLVRRVQEHTSSDGHQSEQFNRDTGFMQGARDLTWSYASFISMVRALNFLLH